LAATPGNQENMFW